MRVYWLEQAEKQVPADDWLCAGEITRLDSLRFAKRRADWRLGRWTAKRAVAAYLHWPAYAQVLARIEIRTAPSGAPEALVHRLGTPVALFPQPSGRQGNVRRIICGDQAGMRRGSS